MYDPNVWEDYYAASEVGKLLGISRMTVYQRIRNGKLPAVRIADRFLIPREAFHRLYPEVQPIERAAKGVPA